jgi:hypothetical protein
MFNVTLSNLNTSCLHACPSKLRNQWWQRSIMLAGSYLFSHTATHCLGLLTVAPALCAHNTAYLHAAPIGLFDAHGAFGTFAQSSAESRAHRLMIG